MNLDDFIRELDDIGTFENGKSNHSNLCGL